jgi:hypothetical protein
VWDSEDGGYTLRTVRDLGTDEVRWRASWSVGVPLVCGLVVRCCACSFENYAVQLSPRVCAALVLLNGLFGSPPSCSFYAGCHRVVLATEFRCCGRAGADDLLRAHESATHAAQVRYILQRLQLILIRIHALVPCVVSPCRQQHLKIMKSFWCLCERCSAPDNTRGCATPLTLLFSSCHLLVANRADPPTVDVCSIIVLLLGSYACEHCGSGTVFLQTYPPEEKKEKKEGAKKGKAGGGDTKEQQQQPDEKQNEACDTCGKRVSNKLKAEYWKCEVGRESLCLSSYLLLLPASCALVLFVLLDCKRSSTAQLALAFCLRYLCAGLVSTSGSSRVSCFCSLNLPRSCSRSWTKTMTTATCATRSLSTARSRCEAGPF